MTLNLGDYHILSVSCWGFKCQSFQVTGLAVCNINVQTVSVTSAVVAEKEGFVQALTQAKERFSNLKIITTDGQQVYPNTWERRRKLSHLTWWTYSKRKPWYTCLSYYITSVEHVDNNTSIGSQQSLYSHDVWHWVKNFSKALVTGCTTKDKKRLLPWIKEITNHVWWSASACGGDVELLVEMVLSLPTHISNIHEGFCGHKKFTRCLHDPFTP